MPSCHSRVRLRMPRSAARCARCPARRSRTRSPTPSSITPTCAACRSEEHTSELQSLMRISYAVFCLKKKKNIHKKTHKLTHDETIRSTDNHIQLHTSHHTRD